ncbi:MAG: hypothetical protein ACO3BH_01265 [Quisquiliibacterium sp.]
MKLEQIWYESSPFIYGLIGLAALLKGDSLLAYASGALLLTAAGTIIRLRWSARIKGSSSPGDRGGGRQRNSGAQPHQQSAKDRPSDPGHRH